MRGPLTVPSCGVRFSAQRACYRVCCISVGAARCQPEKNASPGRQRIYATQEIAHGIAKAGLIMLIQCVQEPVAQDRGSALSGRGGNEVHGVVLARQRLARSTSPAHWQDCYSTMSWRSRVSAMNSSIDIWVS